MLRCGSYLIIHGKLPNSAWFRQWHKGRYIQWHVIGLLTQRAPLCRWFSHQVYAHTLALTIFSLRRSQSCFNVSGHTGKSWYPSERFCSSYGLWWRAITYSSDLSLTAASYHLQQWSVTYSSDPSLTAASYHLQQWSVTYSSDLSLTAVSYHLHFPVSPVEVIPECGETEWVVQEIIHDSPITSIGTRALQLLCTCGVVTMHVIGALSVYPVYGSDQGSKCIPWKNVTSNSMCFLSVTSQVMVTVS